MLSSICRRSGQFDFQTRGTLVVFLSKKQWNNQKGFSLIEAIVGIAAISGVAAMVTTMQNQAGSHGGQLQVCKSVAQSVIKAVQSETVYSRIYNYAALPGARTADKNIIHPNGQAFTTNGIDETDNISTGDDLWNQAGVPNANEIVSTGVAPNINLRNPRLIYGSMRTLNAIYNYAAIPDWSDWREYPGLSVAGLNLTGPLIRTSNPKVEIIVELVNLSTGAIVPAAPAPRPIFVKPNGLTTNQADVVDGGIVAPFNGANRVYDDYGFNLKVKVTYTKKGQEYNCTAAQKFQYEADRDPPLDPKVIITANSSVTPVPGVCASAPAATTMSLEFLYPVPSGITMEPGTVLLCRDKSGIIEWSTDISATTVPAFTDIIGTYPGWQLDLNAQAVASFRDYSSLYTQPLAPVPPNSGYVGSTALQGGWVPCAQLQLCEQAPTSVDFAGGAANDLNTHYKLNYENLPRNCHFNFEVVAVDPAGNTSKIVTDPFNTDTTLEDVGVSISENRVHNPGVGAATLCKATTATEISYWGNWFNNQSDGAIWAQYGPGGTKGSLIDAGYPSAHKLSFHQGYFQCGGCCTGVGCTPFNSTSTGTLPPSP